MVFFNFFPILILLISNSHQKLIKIYSLTRINFNNPFFLYVYLNILRVLLLTNQTNKDEFTNNQI